MLYCVRVPVGDWGAPDGAHPLKPGPAVHSDGYTALHIAAKCGNRRIVRLLVAFNVDVNAQRHYGCAVSACSKSA